jgi:hypothetical protein
MSCLLQNQKNFVALGVKRINIVNSVEQNIITMKTKNYFIVVLLILT